MTRGAGGRASASSTAACSARRAIAPHTAGPMARDEHWSHLAADGALHCTLWAAEWPRIDVRALFLQPLLMDSRTTRTIAMCMELVGPSRAIRQAERAATETATEQSLRARVGQRTSQRQSQRDQRRRPARARARRRPRRRPLRRLRHRQRPRRATRTRSRSSRATSRGSSSRPSAPRCAWSGCGASRPRRSPTACRSAGGCDERSVASAASSAVDERAARREQRARRRSLARELSQRPTARLGRLTRPGGARRATRSRPRTSRPPTPRSPRPASARAASTSARICTAARSCMTRGCSTSAGCSRSRTRSCWGCRTSARAR